MSTAIVCADCGHRRTARNRNTLYCVKCRLLRNLEFLRHRTRRCSNAACSAQFAPTTTHDKFCGKHEVGYSTLRGDCRYCKAERAYLAGPDIPVCITCVRNPALRHALIQALQKGQNDRIANPPPPPEEVSV